MPGRDPIRSVVKAADIVKLVGRSDGGMRLSDVARALGLKTPGTHHLVRTLIDCGFLKRRAGLLVLGDDLLELGRGEHRSAFQEAAATEMQRLFTLFPRGTVVLAETTRYTIDLTLRISYDRPHVLQSIRGHQYHAYANASGLLTLAFGSPELCDHLQQRYPFAEQGTRLWDSRDTLDEFLMDARPKGYVECPFDRDVSYRVAAPVVDADGAYFAALGVSIAVSQLQDDAQRDLIVDELRRSADSLSG